MPEMSLESGAELAANFGEYRNERRVDAIYRSFCEPLDPLALLKLDR